MKRAALYVRVSTQEQALHGLSVDSQIDALRAYCKENGMSEAGLYNDAGISARKAYTKRPGLLQMIEDCKNGKIDIILMTKLDRFFRSVPDYYAVMQQIGQIPWRAIWEDYETETSAGVFKVNIMLSVAQAEADRTGERIKAVNEFRRANGKYLGGAAPLGYVNHKGILSIDPEAEPIVKGMFDTYMATCSVQKVIDYMEQNGIKKCRHEMTRMLANPAYCGDAGGHKCPAYITPEVHQSIVDDIEGRRTRATKYSRVYIFSGLVKCEECGKAFAGHMRHNKVKGSEELRYYTRYYCSGFWNYKDCGNTHGITEEKLEKYLLDNLAEGLDKVRYEVESAPADYEDAAKKIKKLEGKLERIGIRFEDGDLTIEEYRSRRSEIKTEIAQLKKKATAPDLPKLPEYWRDIYEDLSQEGKQTFWRQTLDTITISQDQTIHFTFKNTPSD